MKVHEVIVLLESCGSGQWGLVTTQQAAAVGVPRIWLSRLNQKGIVRKVRQGVYELPSAVRSKKLDLLGAWLATNPGERGVLRKNERYPVVVSHRSAAQVHGLGQLAGDRFTFSTVLPKQAGASDLVYYRADLPQSDIELIDGLPVTSLERTLVDLAETETDQQLLAEVLRAAIVRRTVDIKLLQTRLYKAARQHGFANGAALYAHLEALAPHPDVRQELADTLPKFGRVDLSQLTGADGSELIKMLGLDELVKQAVRQELEQKNEGAD